MFIPKCSSPRSAPANLQSRRGPQDFLLQPSSSSEWISVRSTPTNIQSQIDLSALYPIRFSVRLVFSTHSIPADFQSQVSSSPFHASGCSVPNRYQCIIFQTAVIPNGIRYTLVQLVLGTKWISVQGTFYAGQFSIPSGFRRALLHPKFSPI